MSSYLLAAVLVLLLLLLCLLAWAFNRHLRTAMAARVRSRADQLQDIVRVQKNAEYEQLRATLWRQHLCATAPPPDQNEIYRLFEDRGAPPVLEVPHIEHAGAPMPVTMGFPLRR